MGEKGNLRDFEHPMVVGAKQTGPTPSKTADLLGFSSSDVYFQQDNARHKPQII